MDWNGDSNVFEGPSTGWKRGKATHYGPFPSVPRLSETGFQLNDVAVACSDGRPGGDPRWRAILDEQGVYNRTEILRLSDRNFFSRNSLLANDINSTSDLQGVPTALETGVWPKAFTVAVSQRAWGGSNKKLMCYQKITVIYMGRTGSVLTHIDWTYVHS